jgi:hypothetical protein
MPRVLLDGATLPLTGDAETWGGLLAAVDARLATAGRIVTDVRVDGIDDAAFREPVMLARRLDDITVLEIESGTPARLMDRCLEEAIAAIAPLAAGAQSIGEKFRGHNLTPANQGLCELSEGLSSLIGIVGAAGLAFQVDLRLLRCGDQVAATTVNELGRHLEQLVLAQEQGDWITVADVLQYDVGPSLTRLAPVLESLRQGQPAA